MKKLLYQTTEDRDNPDYVLTRGPFKCTRTPWLGEGYYFWDTFIDYAHWWGKQAYNGSYIITKYAINFEQDEIFDLLDPTYIAKFEECLNVLKDKFNDDNITVPRVIEFMRKYTGFNYKGVRAEGRDSVSQRYNPDLFGKVYFKQGKNAFIALRPPVQICLFSLSPIELDSAMVVYPSTYIESI